MTDINFDFFKTTPKNQTSILIVEDDRFYKSTFSRMLHSIDRDVDLTWLKSAENAIVALQMKHFDLIISDHILDGDKTGYDLWSHCKKEEIRTPFLLISANDLRLQGTPRFLKKPFSIDQCKLALQSIIFDA